jgi:hypothetical protein
MIRTTISLVANFCVEVLLPLFAFIIIVLPEHSLLDHGNDRLTTWPVNVRL